MLPHSFLPISLPLLRYYSVDSTSFCTHPPVSQLAYCPVQKRCTFWNFSPVFWLYVCLLLCPGLLLLFDLPNLWRLFDVFIRQSGHVILVSIFAVVHLIPVSSFDIVWCHVGRSVAGLLAYFPSRDSISTSCGLWAMCAIVCRARAAVRVRHNRPLTPSAFSKLLDTHRALL